MKNDCTDGKFQLKSKIRDLELQNKKLQSAVIQLQKKLSENPISKDEFIISNTVDKSVLKQTEIEKNLILDSTSELFLFYNKNLKIKWANNAVLNYLDIKLKNIEGKHCYEAFFQKDSPCKDCPVLKTMNDKNVHNKIITTPDKKTWEVRGFPVLDNKKNILGLGEVFHDITVQKTTEAELIKAKEKAEESDRLKSVFLANMSHEIRTPMNGIIGFTDMLNNDDLGPEEKKMYAEIIKDSTNQLLHIINDILDLSRIEAKQLKIERNYFDINKFLKELDYEFELIKTKLKKQNIQIHFQNKNTELQIYTDETRLRQIISNLLNNALKFTDEGTIEYGYYIENNKDIVFYVKDTGIGISKSHQKMIFERFRQVDESDARVYSGTGLGLSIVKGLIKILNGKIWLESTPGEGSIFFVSIPYEPLEKTLTKHEKIIKHYKFKNKTVLIVEDEELNIIFFKELLKETGLKCIYADTGNKAIEIVKNNPLIDIILMDIKLPDIDGYSVTKTVKRIRKNVPVIAQTAFAYAEDRTECLIAGCDEYIAKPIRQPDLFNILNKYLNNLE